MVSVFIVLRATPHFGDEENLLQFYFCIAPLLAVSTMTGLPPPPFFLSSPGKPPITWPSWKKTFLNYLVASGLNTADAARRKAILYHCLGTEGQRIFDLLPPATATSDGAGDAQPDEVQLALRTLDSHYSATVNFISERHRFRQRRQQPGEQIDDYVLALRQIASTCDFGPTCDCMLRDQIVEGTNVPHLRERLLLEGSSLTLARTLALARQFEQTQREAKEFAKESDPSVQRVTKTGGTRPSRKRPGSQRKQKSSTTSTHCYRCGSETHLANSLSCKARNQRCLACNKIGHFRSVCRSAGQIRELSTTESSDANSNSTNIPTVLHLESTHSRNKTGIYVTASVEDVDVDFLVDTGSSVSIISADVYNKHFAGKKVLQQTSVNLLDYSRSRIPVHGCFPASVRYQDRKACIIFYVVTNGTTLLGMDALAALELKIDALQLSCFSTLSSTGLPEEFTTDYSHMFDGTLGLARNYVHKVKVRPNVKPVTGKLRRLPLTVREDVSRELRRLEEED